MFKPNIHVLDDEACELSFAEQGYFFDLGGRQKIPSFIRDHRQRLRERFLKGGPDAMPDCELLELILFRAIPRRDVKPLARQLLENFGDFNGVIAAPIDLLAVLNGVGPAVTQELKIVEAAVHRLARARILGKPILSSWQALLDYCQSTMAHRETGRFRVLYLDRKNTLIGDELLAKGTVNHIPVYPR